MWMVSRLGIEALMQHQWIFLWCNKKRWKIRKSERERERVWAQMSSLSLWLDIFFTSKWRWWWHEVRMSLSLSLRNLECKCRQQLWWCLSAAKPLFFHRIQFSSTHSIFYFCSNDVCVCVFVVAAVFLTTFFPFHYFSFILSCSLARSLAQSVVNAVLLLLLFYCRLRFCILHKWINYVLRAQTQTQFFLLLLCSSILLTLRLGFRMDVWCNAFARQRSRKPPNV